MHVFVRQTKRVNACVCEYVNCTTRGSHSTHTNTRIWPICLVLFQIRIFQNCKSETNRFDFKTIVVRLSSGCYNFEIFLRRTKRSDHMHVFVCVLGEARLRNRNFSVDIALFNRSKLFAEDFLCYSEENFWIFSFVGIVLFLCSAQHHGWRNLWRPIGRKRILAQEISCDKEKKKQTQAQKGEKNGKSDSNRDRKIVYSWPHSEESRLIVAVQKQRPLWDQGCVEYKLAHVKSDCWDQVVEELANADINVVEAKKKWNSMRSNFKSSIGKYRARKSGQGTDDIISMTWPHCKEMMFIESIEVEQSTESSSTMCLVIFFWFHSLYFVKLRLCFSFFK